MRQRMCVSYQRQTDEVEHEAQRCSSRLSNPPGGGIGVSLLCLRRVVRSHAGGAENRAGLLLPLNALWPSICPSVTLFGHGASGARRQAKAIDARSKLAWRWQDRFWELLSPSCSS